MYLLKNVKEITMVSTAWFNDISSWLLKEIQASKYIHMSLVSQCIVSIIIFHHLRDIML
jgi:hypothetical protein